MKKLIKLSQKKRFEGISSIRYDCAELSAPLVHIPSSDDVILETISGENWVILMEKVKHANGRYYNFQLNVSGKILDFQMCYTNGHPIVCLHNRDNESVFPSIHNYILDLFGTSMQYNWYEEDLKRYFIPKLQNVSFCIDMHLAQDFTDMENLETFFSTSPVFKWIRLNAALTSQPFSPESKFYQAESIIINQSQHSFPAILRHFEGRQATIECSEWETSEDLIGFVNRWKSGAAFQKLEYLKFKLLKGPLRKNQILNEIGAQYIDRAKKPPTHSLPKVYDFDYIPTEPNTDPIISRAYVVRQSDSYVASILIEEKTISFGVWNKTEEEFLKLMN
ncbi:unnamed protein product [Caenorhabditis nigoni]|nr:hypothetical protein B9Z55_002076 [Caenorhabditis nigoni]